LRDKGIQAHELLQCGTEVFALAFLFVAPDQHHAVQNWLEFFERGLGREKDFGKVAHIFGGENFVGFEFGLERVEQVRVGLFFEQGGLVVGLEGQLDFVGFVDKIQHQRLGFGIAGPVEPAEVWTACTPANFLSTYMVCSSGSSKPVWNLSATISRR